MADQVVDAPAQDTPKAAPKPALDSSKPLSSQVGTLLKLSEQKANNEAGDKQPTIKEPAEGKDEPESTPAPADPEEPAIDDEPDEPEQPKAVELGTVEKFILDRLPTLTARIKDGDTVKTVRFKDVSELPANFELADDAARAQFTVDVAAQVGRAKEALADYRRQELQQKVTAFEAQEAKEVAADLERLQKRGILPKFKYKEDDERFNDDDAVKLANKVYKLFKDTNNAYIKSGKTYRITYADAADKYFARESRRAANDSQKGKEQPKEVKRELTPAQKERQQIAKQTGAPSGGEPTPMKPRVRAGMRMDDINRLVRMGRI